MKTTVAQTEIADKPAESAARPAWQEIKIHFGKKAGTALGSLSQRDLMWWKTNWFPNPRFDSAADKALRAALDAATVEPPKVVASEATGQHAGTVGENLTVEATVDEVFDYETEFNRKKVVQTVALFTSVEGAKLKWKSSADMPAEIVVGATVTLSGSVKDHGEYKGERVTTLTRCKVAGAVKLVATRGLTIFCDAKSREDRFAFCGADGAVLEYGVAGLGRPDNGDNSDHELDAALRAFDFARRVKEAAGLDCIALDFRFDAQWMRGMVGKAKPLRDFAKKHSLLVKMNWISGTENPADEWTTAGGQQTFDGDLASLAMPLESKVV